MPTGTVDHKAEKLFEKFANINPLTTLADGTEKPIYQWEKLDAVQIGDKQRQTGPARQTVVGGFDGVNLQFLFSVTSAIFAHRVLHLLGITCWLTFLVAFKSYTNKLPLGEGLFYCMYRST
jgi:hypothetical protein